MEIIPGKSLIQQPARLRPGLRAEVYVLLAVLAGGGVLRFYSLGHPFYMSDEPGPLLSSLRLAHTSPFHFFPLAANFFAQVFTYQVGFVSVSLPFFSYWILSALGIPLRESILILPSTLAGMASLVAVYWLGRRLFSPVAGLLAAALLAVLPEAVGHSRTVSYVSYVLLFQGLNILAFLRYFERPTRGRAYLASAALTLEVGTNQTFPFTLLAVGVLGLVTLSKEKELLSSLLEVGRRVSRPAIWALPAGAFCLYLTAHLLASSRGLRVGFLQRILGKPGGVGPYGGIFWGAASSAFTPLVCIGLGLALLYVLFRFRARPLLAFPAAWLALVAGASLFLVPELGRFHILLMAVPAVLLLGGVLWDLSSAIGRALSSSRPTRLAVATGISGLLVLSGLTYTLAENFAWDPLRLRLRPGIGAVAAGDRNRAMKTAGYYVRKFIPPESVPLTPHGIYERSLVAQLYFGRRHLPGRTGPTIFLTLEDVRGRRADYVVLFEDGPLFTEKERKLKAEVEGLTREWGMRPVARVRDGEAVLAVIYGKGGEVRDLDVKIYDPLFDQEFAHIRRWTPDFYVGDFGPGF